MKATTAISLLLALTRTVTSTASSACVNPGSIGSEEECATFCQVAEISYDGGGICQCLGSSLGGLWSQFGECTCPGGGDCLPEGSGEPPESTATTLTASSQTDQGESAPALDGFTFVGRGLCVNKDDLDYLPIAPPDNLVTTTIQDCAENCGSLADGVIDAPSRSAVNATLVGFEYGDKFDETDEDACWCLADSYDRYFPNRPLKGPIAKAEATGRIGGVEPYCYSYDAYSPTMLATAF